MLKIREEQVGHLSPVTRRSLRDRIAGHVREALGPGALPPAAPEAAALVGALLEEGLRRGLSWETHLAAYVALRAGLPGQGEAPLGLALNPQAPKAEIAAQFEAFLETLPSPWREICSF